MNLVLRVCLWGTIVSVGSACLGADGRTPHFEVVAIKPVNDDIQMHYVADPVRITYARATVRMLIRDAYGDKYGDRITGPAWLDSEYSVAATFRQGTTKVELRQMLANMLAERFGLAFHSEPREVPGYELRVSQKGAKLPARVAPLVRSNGIETPEPPADAGWQSTGDDNGIAHMTFRRSSMKYLAGTLSLVYTRNTMPLVDRTGIGGAYDLNIDLPTPSYYRRAPGLMQPGSATDLDTGLSSASGYLQRQLGLTLAPVKMTLDFMVVDRVLKVPTEN